MSKARICCALPLYGDSEASGVTRSMLGDFYYLGGSGLGVICGETAWDDGDVELDPSPYPNSIEHARNNLIRMVLDHPRKYTHLWFRDADIKVSSPTMCAKIVGRMLKADKPLIAVPCCQKARFWKQAADEVLRYVRTTPEPTRDRVAELIEGFSARFIPDFGRHTMQLGEPDENGCVPFDEPNLAFSLVRRDCLEAMWARYKDDPALRYDIHRTATADDKSIHEEHVGLFHTMIEDKVYKAEDHAFVKRWNAVGGKSWLYIGEGAPLEHVGYTVFKSTREAMLADWRER